MITFFNRLTKAAFVLLVGTLLLNSCGQQNKANEQEATNETSTESSADPSLSLNFEHFGAYDLSSWEKTPAKNEEAEEGDVEAETTLYKKDGTTLSIEKAESEYYYLLTYTLKSTDGKVQKIRTLEYANDSRQLTETVNDYTLSPAKKFTRQQTVDQSWQQLKSVPTTANGAWQESIADPL